MNNATSVAETSVCVEVSSFVAPPVEAGESPVEYAARWWHAVGEWSRYGMLQYMNASKFMFNVGKARQLLAHVGHQVLPDGLPSSHVQWFLEQGAAGKAYVFASQSRAPFKKVTVKSPKTLRYGAATNPAAAMTARLDWMFHEPALNGFSYAAPPSFATPELFHLAAEGHRWAQGVLHALIHDGWCAHVAHASRQVPDDVCVAALDTLECVLRSVERDKVLMVSGRVQDVDVQSGRHGVTLGRLDLLCGAELLAYAPQLADAVVPNLEVHLYSSRPRDVVDMVLSNNRLPDDVKVRLVMKSRAFWPRHVGPLVRLAASTGVKLSVSSSTVSAFREAMQNDPELVDRLPSDAALVLRTVCGKWAPANV